MNSHTGLDDYQLIVRALSDRLVDAQTPIRVLDAVKWDMLEEWSRTKRAPQHAAWLHAKELGKDEVGA